MRAALAAGEVLVDQAAVIVGAVDALPDDAEPWVKPKAERWLLDHAADSDAKALRILGKRILEVIDPAAADAHEANLLEKEEQAAEAAALLRMSDDGHGKCHGSFTVSSRHGAMLRKGLLAKAAPKHRAAVDGHAPEPGRPSDHRMGLAFQELHRVLPGRGAPQGRRRERHRRGHHDPRDLARWVEGSPARHRRTISAGEARRMACAAGIIPAVLDGKSQVLDLGRKKRFHTTAQRIALGLEQHGCTADGCDWPPGLCHAHHEIPWSKGGDTSLTNGRLLCPRHHALAHRTTDFHPRL